jgi:hypothetical protein
MGAEEVMWPLGERGGDSAHLSDDKAVAKMGHPGFVAQSSLRFRVRFWAASGGSAGLF